MEEIIAGIFELLSQLGYVGIALGLMVEVIPSEIVLSYGGFLVSTGKIHFIGALLAGIAGGTLAQLFLYWLGAYGGRPVLDKYGKYLLIQKKHLDASEKWFEKYGTGVIFTARFIPVIRHAISIPAGIAKMPLSVFTVYTLAAMVPWTVLFLLLGMELGDHWRDIKEYAKPFILPIIVIALVSGAIYLFYMKRKS
ncbi:MULTISPECIES: DedA family protein [Bacillaceae]|jgi:membrane protein DedA with SNARE-associated domain|uniref:DedA family protein n=1 Tax=Cytobacillus firmus TaxID=1399 RepID=A0AA46P8B9_CYTFI|nr:MULTISPECIES: DedA family protein [Bacillaceae]MCC3648063.1 DedA family protein [Cytobacillus oceanisediminis]MCS0653838.1 DedA family protein [Cytobacillus firmus]MCU1805970.1 DedA family protein [Cytobacillus firmus]UYG94936.1 DedA family protein [Cytobacillus firmus]WHY32711.1 DedA family protein [Cytobacillus firmus]